MAHVRRFSYSGNPGNSSLDEVRFLVGDTNKDRALFDNREITWQLSVTPNTRIAGYNLLIAKANEFARQADITVGDVSKAFSDVAENMKKCAQKLKDDALRLARPFFGGLTKSGKRELACRPDDVQPQFFIGQTDDPTAVQLNRDIVRLYSYLGDNAE